MNRHALPLLLLLALPASASGPSGVRAEERCEREEVARVGGHAVQRPRGERALLWSGGLAIDADGAPGAYSPDNRGLDHLGNAGKPGRWWGVATDTGKPSGQPVLQGPADPFPGYYVSTTSLVDARYTERDVRRYVDSTAVPYLALPPRLVGKASGLAALGDLAAVLDPRTGRLAYAIVADVGPADHLGEGSIALATELGLPASPKTGGVRDGLLFAIFPGSGTGRPLPREAIAERGAQLLRALGGEARLRACAASAPR